MENTNTRKQMRGTCLFCGKTYAVDGLGRIVHHGFTISQGNGRYLGYRDGSCVSTGMLAHEVSNEQSILFVQAWEQAVAREEALLAEGKSYDFRVFCVRAELEKAKLLRDNWAPQDLKTHNVAKAQAFETRMVKKIAEIESLLQSNRKRLADDAYWARCVPAAKTRCKADIKKSESDLALHRSVLSVCLAGGDGELALKDAKKTARIEKVQSRITHWENCATRATEKMQKFSAGAENRNHPDYTEWVYASCDYRNAVEELGRLEKEFNYILNH